MKTVLIMIKRNVKLFFKDKGMFFTSLITPAILLVLYATFLSNIYRDSFAANLPQGFVLPEDVLDGLVGGQRDAAAWQNYAIENGMYRPTDYDASLENLLKNLEEIYL